MGGASQAGECCADGCRAFCLAGGQVKGYFVLALQAAFLSARSTAISFCLAGGLLRTRSKAISFCLAGGFLRTRSKAISFCLKAARAGPAVAPALHPRYPANTTARCAGSLSKTLFLTDQARFAPSSARLLAASLRLALENAFASAVVMPPQGQNPGQNLKKLNKEQRTKNKEFNFNKALQILIESYNLLNFYTNMTLCQVSFLSLDTKVCGQIG